MKLMPARWLVGLCGWMVVGGALADFVTNVHSGKKEFSVVQDASSVQNQGDSNRSNTLIDQTVVEQNKLQTAVESQQQAAAEQLDQRQSQHSKNRHRVHEQKFPTIKEFKDAALK